MQLLGPIVAAVDEPHTDAVLIVRVMPSDELFDAISSACCHRAGLGNADPVRV